MQIISKFSDYYDCGIAYGIDKKLRFNRTTQAVDEQILLVSPCVVKLKYIHVEFSFKVIGFCEELYPFVHIVVKEVITKDKKLQFKSIKEHFSYNIESVDKFMRLHALPLSEIGDYEKFGYYDGPGWSWELKGRIEKFFTLKPSKAKELFLKYKVPYFLLEQNFYIKKNGYYATTYKTTLLPHLKNFKFVKVKEPIQAFQAISMYLGSLDLNENKTVKIEDKYLSRAKGFDCYSFKKTPSKKEIKKC